MGDICYVLVDRDIEKGQAGNRKSTWNIGEQGIVGHCDSCGKVILLSISFNVHALEGSVWACDNLIVLHFS